VRKKPTSVEALTELGRVRLSRSFFMRDMLCSEVAQAHGLLNAPDDPELAVAVGARLCEDLLEPLQDKFGRLAIRSAYRSAEVNALGNARGYNCASNEKNAGKHIWDLRDADGCMGAMAAWSCRRSTTRIRSPVGGRGSRAGSTTICPIRRCTSSRPIGR
jgi:hypothetical protein